MKKFGDWAVYRYEAVAFLTGAAVMVLEIVGARLIAPQFGTSTYVWTAMIGVIMVALAVGYAVGGRLADNDKATDVLGLILTLAAVLVIFMGLFQQAVLRAVAELNLDLRLAAFLAALILFGLPSMFVGMVSPHLAKIRVTSTDVTGRIIGRLEAAGALGSILGTFLTGYVLLGMFGSRILVSGVALLLLATSFLASTNFMPKVRLAVAVVALLAAALVTNPPGILTDIDSSYGRYRVWQGFEDGKPVRYLLSDNLSIQSTVGLDHPYEPATAYNARFLELAEAAPRFNSALVIGGGTFTLPSSLHHHFTGARIDSVEIDPVLQTLAKQYFFLHDSPEMNIYDEDGRLYLNHNQRHYDAVYMDAFSTLSPPFQLTTVETVRHLSDSLAPEGFVAANIVGDYDGGDNAYLRAVTSTYRRVFGHVALYQADAGVPLSEDQQNFILVAAHDDATFTKTARVFKTLPLTVESGGLVLTDNFAPIEALTFR